MPAGPLLNARYVAAALEAGFCLPTYKTVRSRAWRSHPHPNVLAIEDLAGAPVASLRAAAQLARVRGRAFLAADYAHPEALSISNSFGVPSRAPGEWADDVAKLEGLVAQGSRVVLSFQGTRSEAPEVAGCGPSGTLTGFLEDTLVAARLAALAARRFHAPSEAPLLEVNLSCPNEAGAPVYRNVGQSIEIARALRRELEAEALASGRPRCRLVAKIGVLDDASCLALLRGARDALDGVSAINTVSASIEGADGSVVLGAGVASGGVCGRAIFAQGLAVVEKLAAARRALRLEPSEMGIVGVGGVMGAREFVAYRQAGADVVQAATGAMWNLKLAQDVARVCGVPFEVLAP
jgi:dihydroorotate dehydrogenase